MAFTPLMQFREMKATDWGSFPRWNVL